MSNPYPGGGGGGLSMSCFSIRNKYVLSCVKKKIIVDISSLHEEYFPFYDSSLQEVFFIYIYKIITLHRDFPYYRKIIVFLLYSQSSFLICSLVFFILILSSFPILQDYMCVNINP